MYAPNIEADCETFLNQIFKAVIEKNVSKTDSVLQIGDFNVYIGNDSQTWSDDKDLNT